MRIFDVTHSYERDATVQMKRIGCFASRAEAEASVDVRRGQPGFCAYPDGWRIAEWFVDEVPLDGVVWTLWAGQPDEYDDVDDEHPSCRLVGVFATEAAARAAPVDLAPGEIRRIHSERIGGCGGWSDGFVTVG